MQMLSNRDNLHEMSNLVFWENKKNVINMSAAELAPRVVKVNRSHVVVTDMLRMVTL